MQLIPPNPYESQVEQKMIQNSFAQPRHSWNQEQYCDFLHGKCEQFLNRGYNRQDVLFCRILDNSNECNTPELSTGTDQFVFLAFVAMILVFVYKVMKL